jgi:hypothetical protein
MKWIVGKVFLVDADIMNDGRNVPVFVREGP